MIYFHNILRTKPVMELSFYHGLCITDWVRLPYTKAMADSWSWAYRSKSSVGYIERAGNWLSSGFRLVQELLFIRFFIILLIIYFFICICSAKLIYDNKVSSWHTFSRECHVVFKLFLLIEIKIINVNNCISVGE